MAKAKSRGRSGATAGDLLAAVNRIAPLEYAEDWDNVGLLAGRPEQPVRRVLAALDLTDAAAEEALKRKADGLLLYHPPIFKGVRSITPGAQCPTGMLSDLLRAGVAIVAVHTAFDSVEGGANDLLLDLFETTSRRPLEVIDLESDDYKLTTFAPAEHIEALRQALSEAGAGVIGHYSECGFEVEGCGVFRGDATTNPRLGKKLVTEKVAETRLEMTAPRGIVGEVVRALYAAHPYEEPAFDLYPLRKIAGRGRVGAGRVGKLKKATGGEALVKQLAAGADMSIATVTGNLKRKFTSVTAGAGSFGTRRFRDPESLYITGEFKHHDALELLRRGVTAICLGHYASEAPAVEALCRMLRGYLKGVEVVKSRTDASPFRPVRA